MNKKFLQIMTLSAVIGSFGSIDSIQAENCSDYNKDGETCNNQPTCRWQKMTGPFGKCWTDECKPFPQDQCITGQRKKKCAWTQGRCTILPKKGFSDWS
jgi:hypothetical protein